MGMNVVVHGEDSVGGLPQKIKSTGDALHGYEASLGAGDEGVSSATLSRKRINNRAFCTKLASSTSAQYIGNASGVPVYIKGIRLMSTNAGTITIAGFSTPSSIASLSTTLVFPATTTTVPLDILFPGIAREFSAGCTITCATAADGLLVLVDWEEIP